MGIAWRIFYAALAVIATFAIAMAAYKMIPGSNSLPGAAKATGIDYTNFVVILLTTVTVIFSVCALVLAILGVIGFRSLKREAGKFASQQALFEISSAFAEGGRAHLQVQAEFAKEDGHFKKWAERAIRREVITLLPLVMDRLPKGGLSEVLDEDSPTDEGDVD